MKRLLVLFALICLGGAPQAYAQDYHWDLKSDPTVIAPSDQVVEGKLSGSSLQGTLLDLRYRQACVEVQGQGVILEFGDTTSFSLDGQPSSAEELSELVKEGAALSAAVRYSQGSGMIGWLDAFSSNPMSAISLQVKPAGDTFFQPGQSVEVYLPQSVVQSHSLKAPSLRVPGMTRKLPFQACQGGMKATLPIMQGWNWHNVPLYVTSGSVRVFRGPTISTASSRPHITQHGPDRASQSLSRIPCWVTIDGPLYLLDPSATRITLSKGAKASPPRTRSARVEFWIEVDKPGTYWVRATIKDKLGGHSSKKWPIQVLPAKP